MLYLGLGIRERNSAGLSSIYPIEYTIGSTKLAANQEAYLLDNINASNITQHVKVEAEAPFSRVRLRFYHRSSGAGTLKIALAPTESATNSSDNTRYKPIKAGAVDDSQWIQGTFAGNAVGNILAGSEDDIGITVSDWIDVNSLIPTAGERPFLLMRLNINAAGLTVVTSGAMDLWRAASNQPWYRLMDKSQTSGDNTSNPATIPSGAFTGGQYWYGFEFDYGVETNTILAVGDSKTAGGGGQTATFDQWSLIAANLASTPAKPYNSYNIGMSGKSSVKFTQALYNEFDAGFKPKYVVYPSFSGNDGNPTQASIDNMIQRIKDVAARCALEGCKLIVWGTTPNDNYASTVDALRMQTVDWVNNPTNQQAHGFAALDWNELCGEWNASNNTWDWKAGYVRPDNIHPSSTAIQAMAASLADKILELA